MSATLGRDTPDTRNILVTVHGPGLEQHGDPSGWITGRFLVRVQTGEPTPDKLCRRTAERVGQRLHIGDRDFRYL